MGKKVETTSLNLIFNIYLIIIINIIIMEKKKKKERTTLLSLLFNIIYLFIYL